MVAHNQIYVKAISGEEKLNLSWPASAENMTGNAIIIIMTVSISADSLEKYQWKK